MTRRFDCFLLPAAAMGLVATACGANAEHEKRGQQPEDSIDGFEISISDQSFPYIAALIDRGLLLPGNEIKHYCAATLVHPQWVLTAAHCLQAPAVMAFITGTKKLSDVLPCTGDGCAPVGNVNDADASFAHEKYDPVTGDSDIALVRLKSPAVENTVELATPADMENYASPGQAAGTTTASVLGWAHAQAGSKPHVLRQVDLSAKIRADECSDTSFWSDDNQANVTNNQICMASLDETRHARVDDSGGPALVRSAGVWRQIGVVTKDAPQTAGAAEPSEPAILARVSNFYDWIYSHLPTNVGVGRMFATDGTGALTSLRTHGAWTSLWHTIVAGDFGGSAAMTDLAFYHQRIGHLAIYTTDGAGGMTHVKTTTGMRTTWQKIIAGNFGGNGRTDLMFYDPTTTPWSGQVEFHTTDGAGNLTLLRKLDVSKTWHNIVPGNFGGTSHTDLATYDATTGQLFVYISDGTGKLALLKQLSTRRTWQNIVAGQFGGDELSDLAFYSPKDGIFEIHTVSNTGTLTRLLTRDGFDKYTHTIVSGNFNGDAFSDLLFYSQDLRSVSIWSTNGAGGMTELKRHVNQYATSVIAGDFGGSAETDFLFYSRWK